MGDINYSKESLVAMLAQAEASNLKRGEALKSVAQRAEALFNSLSLVCGSRVLPIKFRKPLAALAQSVREIHQSATEAMK